MLYVLFYDWEEIIYMLININREMNIEKERERDVYVVFGFVYQYFVVVEEVVKKMKKKIFFVCQMQIDI